MTAFVGKYELLFELARGGMGVVHAARAVGPGNFERVVVVKRLHPHLAADPALRKTSADEARVMAKLHDAHIASIVDVVEEGDELSLVLEYVESVSLAGLRKLARDRGEVVPLPIAMRIVVDALAGLDAAHGALDARGEPLGLIHRDVSPQNVIVGTDGTSRIIDFGIAKATADPTSGDTATGMLKGKIRYMSPEQVKQLPLDRRSDVFSAAVVLYEAVTGETPFRCEDSDPLLALLVGDLVSPREHVPGISPELEAIMMRALARGRDGRYATAAELADALLAVGPVALARDVAKYVADVAGPTIAERRSRIVECTSAPARRAPTPSAARRSRRAIAGAAVGVALVAAGVTAAAHFRRGVSEASASPVAIASESGAPTPSVATLDPPKPIDSAPARPSAPPAHATSPARTFAGRARATASPSCTPPYEVRPDGTHRFKPECFR